MTSKVQTQKINKRDYSKQTGFCTVYETIHKPNRQSTECNKIFSNHTSDKMSTSKLYNKFKQLNSKKNPKNTIKNEQRTQIDLFFQKRYSNGQQEHEKVLNITNQNPNRSPHTCWHGYCQKQKQ